MSYKFLFITVFILSFLQLKAQDVIYTKSKIEIKSKINEVTPRIIKYQKFENLDGPIYSINISDIIYVKYQNGSIDLFDKTFELQTKLIQPNSQQANSNLSPVSEVKTTKEPSKIKEELTQLQKDNSQPLVTDSKIIETKKSSEKLIEPNNSEKEKIKLETPIKSKYKSRKQFWLISGLLFSGIGTFAIIQSGSLYNEYKTATTNANSLHSRILTYNTLSPIAFGLGGLSAIGFAINLSKEKKETISKSNLETKVSLNQISLKYSF